MAGKTVSFHTDQHDNLAGVLSEQGKYEEAKELSEQVKYWEAEETHQLQLMETVLL